MAMPEESGVAHDRLPIFPYKPLVCPWCDPRRGMALLAMEGALQSWRDAGLKPGRDVSGVKRLETSLGRHPVCPVWRVGLLLNDRNG